MKKYSRDNKKHYIEESRKVFDDFYYSMLGYGLQLIGEKHIPFKGMESRWVVYSIHSKRWKFVRSHWWRGNQK